MIFWHEPATPSPLRNEIRFWVSVIVWPFIVVWYLFVDYVWPWLWKTVIGLLIGVTLGLLFRVFYLGETPFQIWSTILSIFRH